MGFFKGQERLSNAPPVGGGDELDCQSSYTYAYSKTKIDKEERISSRACSRYLYVCETAIDPLHPALFLFFPQFFTFRKTQAHKKREKKKDQPTAALGKQTNQQQHVNLRIL